MLVESANSQLPDFLKNLSILFFPHQCVSGSSHGCEAAHATQVFTNKKIDLEVLGPPRLSSTAQPLAAPLQREGDQQHGLTVP